MVSSQYIWITRHSFLQGQEHFTALAQIPHCEITMRDLRSHEHRCSYIKNIWEILQQQHSEGCKIYPGKNNSAKENPVFSCFVQFL